MHRTSSVLLAMMFAIVVTHPHTAGSQQDELNVYFGNLHAHSHLSDGEDTSPAEAYDFAKDIGGMDFLSLSEHNHYLTGDEFEELMEVAESKNTSDFVALYGQEFSLYDSPYNHTNRGGP